MDDERKQQLIEEHRRKLVERKKKREAIESESRKLLFENVENIQKRELIKRIHLNLAKILAIKKFKESWLVSWTHFVNEWQAIGVGKNDIINWFTVGIDTPMQARRYQYICEILGIKLSNSEPIHLDKIRKHLRKNLHRLASWDALELLIECEMLGLIDFNKADQDAIYGLSLISEGGNWEPDVHDNPIVNNWVFAEKSMTVRPLRFNEKIPDLKKLSNSVVDALIEKKVVDLVEIEKIKTRSERIYFTARVEPSSLSDKVVEEVLAWDYEIARRQFNQGQFQTAIKKSEFLERLHSVQTKAQISIDDLQKIPLAQDAPEGHTAIVEKMLQFIESGQVTDTIEKDPDTWKILYKLSPQNCDAIANPYGNLGSRFRRWCFIRKVQKCLLDNDEATFLNLVTEPLLKDLSGDSKLLRRDLLTSAALFEIRKENLVEARTYLKRADETLTSEATKHNLNLLKREQDFEKSRLNPFLLVGISPDCTEDEWKSALRKKRTEAFKIGGSMEMDLNWAKAIKEGTVQNANFFRYPVSPEIYRAEPQGLLLHPPPTPFPRRYSLEDEIDSIRKNAVDSLISKIALNLD